MGTVPPGGADWLGPLVDTSSRPSRGGTATARPSRRARAGRHRRATPILLLLSYVLVVVIVTILYYDALPTASDESKTHSIRHKKVNWIALVC
jgi:hypothetical protein